MINIAEILKDCPKGIQLYSPICGDCTFEKIHLNTIIVVSTQGCVTITFNVYGQYFTDFDNAECLLFPSKDNRDWNTFQKPFKDGDIISNGGYIAIFHKFGKPDFCTYDKVVYYHCWCNKKSKESKFKNDFGIGRDTEYRFATDEEKQIMFDVIKANGYKWNDETKTLEKLIVPKFKVGDKIVNKKNLTECWYVQGINTNLNSEFYYIYTKNEIASLYFKDQDEWVLVPVPKFKVGDIVKTTNTLFDYKIIKITDTHYTLESIPGANTYDMFICEDENWKLIPKKFDISTLKAYDKVLVRDSNEREWSADLFSHILDRPLGGYAFVCVGDNPKQCIPYEGNEYLLGTSDDCDEYYKNW